MEELRNFLREQFKTYVRDPGLHPPGGYRPVRVYVGGEVKRPGYYTLTVSSISLLYRQKASSYSSRLAD